MALHGDVSVNGNKIMTWAARRLHDVGDGSSACEYEVDATWYEDGDVVRVAHTYLWHFRDAGAEMLTIKVLSWAAFQRGLVPA